MQLKTTQVSLVVTNCGGAQSTPWPSASGRNVHELANSTRKLFLARLRLMSAPNRSFHQSSMQSGTTSSSSRPKIGMLLERNLLCRVWHCSAWRLPLLPCSFRILLHLRSYASFLLNTISVSLLAFTIINILHVLSDKYHHL